MRPRLILLGALFFGAYGFGEGMGCVEEEHYPKHESDAVPASYVLSGAAEKGPMIIGSSIDVTVLGADGSATGVVRQTETQSDQGDFSIEVEDAEVVRIEATGYYFNEVTGELSAGPLTLRALYAAGTGVEQVSNVNLLTHLAYPRALALFQGGTAAGAAISQAETEVKAILPLDDSDASAASAMTVTSSAYLLAVSAVLTQAAVLAAGDEGSIEAELQQLANEIGAALAGEAESTEIIDALATAVRALDVELVTAQIAARLAETGGPTAPDLDTVIDTDGDGTVNSEDACRWMAGSASSGNGICFVASGLVGEPAAGAAVPALRDLDLDGNLDLIISRDYAGIETYRGDGKGNFESHEYFDAEGLYLWADASTADLDGDTLPDMVGRNGTGTILLIQGESPRQLPEFYADPDLTCDVDGDGDPDLVQGLYGYGSEVTVHIDTATNDGSGNFAVQDQQEVEITELFPGYTYSYAGVGVSFVGCADVTDDGPSDLIVVAYWDGDFTPMVIPGDVDGQFGQPTAIGGSSDVGMVLHFELADIDGDTDRDFVVIASGGDGILATTYVGLNSSLVYWGQATTTVQLPANGWGGGAVFGDFTGDGIADAIVKGAISSNATFEIALLSGVGENVLEFANGTTFPKTLTARYGFNLSDKLASGDINNDGTSDLVIGLSDQVAGSGTPVAGAALLFFNPATQD